MSVRSPWLARLALLAAGSLVALALAELGVRLLWPRREPPGGSEGLPVVEDVLELATPHVRGISHGVLHRTDRIGLRGPDYESVPPASVFRIALAGDSIAMGHGVAEEDRYSDRLVPLLDAARPRERHEVVNAALSGLDARNVVLRLERALAEYRAHMLVYGFCVNDIEGPAYQRLAATQSTALHWSRLRDIERTPSRLWALLLALQLRHELEGLPIAQEIRHNYFENPAAWSDFTRQLDRFAALAAERGACPILFVQPQLQRLSDAHPYLDVYARVSRAAQERGIHVVDAFDAFRGRVASWYWVSPADPHPNEAAHAVLARVLADGLLALPERCWQRDVAPPSAASPR